MSDGSSACEGAPGLRSNKNTESLEYDIEKSSANTVDDSRSPGAPASSLQSAPANRFSTHVLWTLATRFAMVAGSVCASVIVARWLGADGLGMLAVLNVTVAVAVQIGSGGLPSANTFFIAGDKSYLAPAWANAILFAIIAGSVLAFGVIVLAKFYAAFFGDMSVELIAIAALSVPFQLISLLGLNIFLGLSRIAHFNTLDAAAQAFALINATLVLVILGSGLRTLVALNTVASILMCLLIVWMIQRTMTEMSVDRRFRPNATLFKSMARYGIKFHIAVVAGMLIFRADLLLVNHFRGSGEAGVYAIASQAATMLMLLPSVIGTLLMPRAVLAKDERGEMTMRVTRHTAFLMLMICLAAAPASFALPLLYGAPFKDVPILLLILLPGIYLVSLESVLVQHFTSIGLPVAIPMFWLVTLGINVALNLIFVPTFGARAAAAASSISYALIFVLVALYFRIKTGNRFSDIMLVRADEFRQIFAVRRT